MEVIKVDNVRQKYVNNDEDTLKNINLSVSSGEFCMLLGSSGSGKSTLLRTINGFVPYYEGKIIVNGREVLQNKKDLRQLRGSIGMIFQEFNLVNRLSVLENVLCGFLPNISNTRALIKYFNQLEKNKAMAFLEQVKLDQFANKRVDQLSGGQKQRVAIARALAQGPDIILADEPVASLDPATSKAILKLLRTICQDNGLTCIVSIHQIEYALEFGQRIIGLNQGKISFDSSKQEITDNDIQKIYANKQDEE